MTHKDPVLRSATVALTGVAFFLLVLGCGKGDGDFVPGKLDGGPPPGKDLGVKKDKGTKPPPPKFVGGCGL